MVNSIDSIVHILKLRLILSRQTILAQRPNRFGGKMEICTIGARTNSPHSFE